jgi:hypothetical protein
MAGDGEVVSFENGTRSAVTLALLGDGTIGTIAPGRTAGVALSPRDDLPEDAEARDDHGALGFQTRITRESLVANSDHIVIAPQ